jgi:hypothetical protein
VLPPYVGLLFSDNYNLTNRSGTFYFLHNNMDFTYIRAMNYMELSVRRRSLAPVR